MRHHLLPILVATVLVAGCGESQERAPVAGSDVISPGGDYTPVIATIGDLEITKGYFDYRYEMLPPGEKGRYSGEDWETRFLDALLDEILVSVAARDENLHRQQDVRWAIDKLQREVLFQSYYRKHFQDELEIPEVELRQHYNQYRDRYTLMGRAMVHHIQTASKETIDRAWDELQKGERFHTVAVKYSEDPNSKDDGGVLGWVNPGGYVVGRGFDEEFTDIVFSLEADQVSQPVQLGDNWHIIRVGRKTDGEIQPFDAVRERIERELRPLVQREAYEDRLVALREQYDVKRFAEFDTREKRSAEELYRLAGESLNKFAKLDYYQRLVENYPQHERADDALFMAGFVASEEVFSAAEAARYYRRLIDEYPDSEFVEDAKYMLGNISAPREGALAGSGAPKTAEDAAQRIQSIRQ